MIVNLNTLHKKGCCGLRPLELRILGKVPYEGLTSGVRVTLCFAKPNPSSPTAARLLNEDSTLNISNSDIRNRNRILDFFFIFKRITKEVELKDLGLNFDDFT